MELCEIAWQQHSYYPYNVIMMTQCIGGGTRGAMAPQISLVMLLAPSDYVPFNKCKDFFAVNERRKNYFGTF